MSNTWDENSISPDSGGLSVNKSFILISNHNAAGEELDTGGPGLPGPPGACLLQSH